MSMTLMACSMVLHTVTKHILLYYLQLASYVHSRGENNNQPSAIFNQFNSFPCLVSQNGYIGGISPSNRNALFLCQLQYHQSGEHNSTTLNQVTLECDKVQATIKMTFSSDTLLYTYCILQNQLHINRCLHIFNDTKLRNDCISPNGYA